MTHTMQTMRVYRRVCVVRSEQKTMEFDQKAWDFPGKRIKSA